MVDSTSTRHRVLVAEDVKVISRAIRTALDRRGYETDVAADGAECLDKVRAFEPQLIILDLMMPKIHGIDVLKQLKSHEATRGIGVIVCTSKDFKTELSTIRDLGVDDIIVKPFERDDLLLKVDRYFSGNGVLDTREAYRRSNLPMTGEVFEHEFDTALARYYLWGTRGSIPVTEPQYIRHGGNTSCMDLTVGDEYIIFDAGSGIRNLGQVLLAHGPRKVHLFITHTHWDHIQGFPFFAPAFAPGFDITIYGERGFGKDLESLFKGQLDRDYFPVQMEDMNAQLDFRYLGDEPIHIGPATVSWTFTQHPGATVGYRVDVDGKRLAYVPDNEFLKGYTGAPFDIHRDSELVGIYQPLVEFLDGVDVLLHEAQYTADEYTKKVGWGHCSVPNACALAKLTQPKRWIVIHHDPSHADNFLQVKMNMTRQLLDRLECPTELIHGYDGMFANLV